MQTILYLKCDAIFRDEHYPNRRVREAHRICCFNITFFWKTMDPCMQFRSSKGLEKKLTYKIPLKHIFTSYDRVPFTRNPRHVIIAKTYVRFSKKM